MWMSEWSTTSELVVDAPPDRVWNGAYADPGAWPFWNPELVSARLDGPLALGATARIRFRTGARLRFRVVEYEDGRLFTDETRLPGARMGHRHLLEEVEGGRTRLRNTIYLRGPLAGFWARVVGRRAAAALTASQAAIAGLAGPAPSR
jgi:hypothetical protein